MEILDNSSCLVSLLSLRPGARVPEIVCVSIGIDMLAIASCRPKYSFSSFEGSIAAGVCCIWLLLSSKGFKICDVVDGSATSFKLLSRGSDELRCACSSLGVLERFLNPMVHIDRLGFESLDSGRSRTRKELSFSVDATSGDFFVSYVSGILLLLVSLRSLS